MITRNQKITIAILIPIAVVMGFFAVQTFLKHRREQQETEQYLAMKQQVEEGRRQEQPKKEKEQPKPAQPEKAAEFPKLYMPRDIAALGTAEERYKVANDMLDFLARTDAKPEERDRAYRTLINCQGFATIPLYNALDPKTPQPAQRLYYALKACADLKSIYNIDLSADRSFADAAVKIGNDAPADVRTQLACLLGYYKDKVSVARLEKRAADPDPGVQYTALASLCRVGGRSSVSVIAAALQSKDPAILAAACRALQAIVSYDVGTEFTSLKDYGASLDTEAAKWRKWWEDNKASYQDARQ